MDRQLLCWLAWFSSLVLAVRGRTAFKAHFLCSAYGYEVVVAKFGREQHVLCLKPLRIGSSSLLSHQSAALLLDPEVEDNQNTIQAFPLKDVTMMYGFPVEDPAAGSAEGYIGDDLNFYGVLHLRNRTLHADPYGQDRPGRAYGPFEADYASSFPPVTPAPERHRRRVQSQQMDGSDLFGTHFPYTIVDHERVPGIARARVCDLLLLADLEFYQKDANSSLNHVVRRMVHAVAQADIIFRNTDFNEDGIPDNIGFSIKYILVLTSNDTNFRVFGDLLGQKAVDGRQYLMRFARLRRLSEVCLGVAFSGHAFHNRTLGLSFTSLGGGMGGAAGGLCDRRAYGRSFNTLALAHSTAEETERVPDRIAALTLAHEMGHSFGAHHDDNFPNPECRGYLMGSQSSAAQTNRHYEFSLCSKRLIAATLNSMSYCLSDVDKTYCGNGIVEEGEACDCGIPSRCSQMDPCCTPRAGGALVFEEGTLHKEGCSVSPQALCHPSQGLCCNEECQHVDLSQSGIDCKSQDLECTCAEMADCRCGLGGFCLEDGSCHAAECARLGLQECQCYKKGVGGSLARKRLCGVCCKLESERGGREGECVGAEFAAQNYLSTREKLPDGWPDDKYRGLLSGIASDYAIFRGLKVIPVTQATCIPNFIKIGQGVEAPKANTTLHLCNTEYCTSATVRAWAIGETCVTRNVVGLCAVSGICRPRLIAPISNIYPNTMSIRLMSQKNSSRRIKKRLLNFLVTVVIAFVIK